MKTDVIKLIIVLVVASLSAFWAKGWAIGKGTSHGGMFEAILAFLIMGFLIYVLLFQVLKSVWKENFVLSQVPRDEIKDWIGRVNPNINQACIIVSKNIDSLSLTTQYFERIQKLPISQQKEILKRLIS